MLPLVDTQPRECHEKLLRGLSGTIAVILTSSFCTAPIRDKIDAGLNIRGGHAYASVRRAGPLAGGELRVQAGGAGEPSLELPSLSLFFF